jgi:hypothetical protein
MARQLWFNPANPAQFALVDSRLSRPPAGYVQAETADGGRGGAPLSSGSSFWGVQQQQIQTGDSSGGWPPYTGINNNGQPKFPNGRLGSWYIDTTRGT